MVAVDTIESNKALVRRFVDEIFVRGNVDAADELLTNDFVAHTWGAMAP
jgi:hypothetical protein